MHIHRSIERETEQRELIPNFKENLYTILNQHIETHSYSDREREREETQYPFFTKLKLYIQFHTNIYIYTHTHTQIERVEMLTRE